MSPSAPPPPNRTPDWLIERLAQGELDPQAAEALRQRLVEEGRAPDELLRALAESDAQILRSLPVADAAATIRRRATAASAPLRRGWAFGGALAVAGTLAIVVLTVRPDRAIMPAGDSAHDREATRTKGGSSAVGLPALGERPRLLVYRHGRDGDQRLTDGSAARQGDLVQLAYAAATPAFGVLLSLDGRGQVTQHWPPSRDAGTIAAPLRAEREVRLPSAYELDDAPAFERFFLVAADRPFPVAPVLAAARQLATRAAVARVQALPLPPPFQQVSLVLDKPAIKESR